MSKQHPNVAKLREFQRWRRGADTEQPAPKEIGELLDWAILVCENADRLVNAKGKQAEKAYARLEAAVNTCGTPKARTKPST